MNAFFPLTVLRKFSITMKLWLCRSITKPFLHLIGYVFLSTRRRAIMICPPLTRYKLHLNSCFRWTQSSAITILLDLSAISRIYKPACFLFITISSAFRRKNEYFSNLQFLQWFKICKHWNQHTTERPESERETGRKGSLGLFWQGKINQN